MNTRYINKYVYITPSLGAEIEPTNAGAKGSVTADCANGLVKP